MLASKESTLIRLKTRKLFNDKNLWISDSNSRTGSGCLLSPRSTGGQATSATCRASRSGHPAGVNFTALRVGLFEVLFIYQLSDQEVRGRSPPDKGVGRHHFRPGRDGLNAPPHPFPNTSWPLFPVPCPDVTRTPVLGSPVNPPRTSGRPVLLTGCASVSGWLDSPAGCTAAL